MRIPATARRTRRLISLTPLIDVVFILLVFFMLASNFTRWRPIPLQSATLGNAWQTQSEPPLSILVYQDKLKIDNHEIRLGEFSHWLVSTKSSNDKAAVLLIPGKGVDLQRIVSVIDILELNGINSVTLAQ
jgi:biopolymer transport protein ExbD